MSETGLSGREMMGFRHRLPVYVAMWVVALICVVPDPKALMLLALFPAGQWLFYPTLKLLSQDVGLLGWMVYAKEPDECAALDSLGRCWRFYFR